MQTRNRKFQDLTGNKYGRLTVIGFHSKASGGLTKWTCRCDCGNEIVAYAGNLKRPNHTTSCGCAQAEITSKRSFLHGKSNTKEFRAWAAAKNRTTNPNNFRYPYYGGRGIKMCDHWLNSFKNFLQDMGKSPTPKHTLERKDTNGNYSPDNCIWATRIDQMNNTRKNHRITYAGETHTIAQWSRKLNLNPISLCTWIHKGLPVDEAIQKSRLT